MEGGGIAKTPWRNADSDFSFFLRDVVLVALANLCKKSLRQRERLNWRFKGGNVKSLNVSKCCDLGENFSLYALSCEHTMSIQSYT